MKRHRETVFDPAVAAHNGRVVKLIGDGTIVEFASAVDAVNCALSVQRSGAPAPDHRAAAIVLRIGINLGDVIMEGEDIYGDGVNIAARLEPLAEPGGICISSIVNESIGNRIDVRFQDGGEITVKNIDRPIRIWRWQAGTAAANSRQPNAANLWPRRPQRHRSPFCHSPTCRETPNRSISPNWISEDIITDLSKIAGLIVIARNSSFTYKGRSVDVRAVGRELGVRSVLEGSIRRAGQRVRITAQLIDAEKDKGKRAIRDSKASRASRATRLATCEPAGLARPPQQILEELKSRGFGQNQQGKPGQQGQGQGDINDLGRAGEAMSEAESSLGEGNADSAVDSQGRALDALRNAQGLRNRCSSRWDKVPVPAAAAARPAARAAGHRSAVRCAGANTATTTR